MELIYHLIDERILELLGEISAESADRIEELIALKMRIAEMEQKNE